MVLAYLRSEIALSLLSSSRPHMRIVCSVVDQSTEHCENKSGIIEKSVTWATYTGAYDSTIWEFG